MTGLNSLDGRTVGAIEKILATAYPPDLCDIDRLEDMVLATPGRRDFSAIGTDIIKGSTMKYIVGNLFWISVCLFVNEDFRDCFHDAILIEKALLQVTETEYQDFREDMILADDDGRQMGDVVVAVDLSRYKGATEMTLQNGVDSAKKAFYNAGMMDAYDELSSGFNEPTKEAVSYVIHNLLYMVNAVDKNGVFNKYVHLVVDSVRDQLSGTTK